MIHGSGCDTCEDMEKVNLLSMRQDYTLDANNYFRKSDSDLFVEPLKLKDCYNENTHKVNNNGLRHVEFRFSTACNFACLHCSKVYSSGWKSKLKKFTPDDEVINYDLRQLLGTEHRHGPNDETEMSLTTEQALEIVEDLNENFPYLQNVDFAGVNFYIKNNFFLH